jgi:hypothetical protein
MPLTWTTTPTKNSILISMPSEARGGSLLMRDNQSWSGEALGWIRTSPRVDWWWWLGQRWL